ncbi:unnamed protein product [Leptidea sinapis]|uniref:Uncharacterized protein n=1 Tax=Leptidea sinapis TaxID=189913 RepID=A0A5E4QNB7_9NEOP|nr:unnamed protein product [Leptidea sinapis]
MSGDCDRASRPNSLLLEIPAPEKEPLRFDVNLVGAPPEVEQLVNNIKQVAEDFLYHWKTFPIVLPQSKFTGAGNHPADIIITPPCDELDAAALDAGLEPHPLSPKQLHSIKEKGLLKDKFNPKRLNAKQLESIRQWGLTCGVWRAGCSEVASEPARSCTSTWLAPQPCSWWWHATACCKFDETNVDKRLSHNSLSTVVCRCYKFLIMMPFQPEDREDIATLAAWVTRAMRRAAAEKIDARESSRTVPRVDLRLYRRDILRRAAASLQAIVERESRGWFLHFREKHAAHLASQKVPMKDIEEEVSAAAMREYVSRVCRGVTSCGALQELGPHVPALLADQLRAAAILHRSEEGVRRKLDAGLATAEARLRTSHPILSRSHAWRKERLNETARELRAAQTPTCEFKWATRIWLPRNWVVVRHFRGKSERIPTVISSRATNIVTPRSDPSQPVFLVHREKIRTTTTRWPGWRLLGKGLSRQANRIWNYGIVGGLGSVGLLLLFPVVVLMVSGLCLVVAASVPLWMPLVALSAHVVSALLWFVLFEVLLWRIGLLGIVQPVVAVAVALVLCPLSALILLVETIMLESNADRLSVTTESDSPVPLESDLCADILRSLEDAPDCDDRRAKCKICIYFVYIELSDLHFIIYVMFDHYFCGILERHFKMPCMYVKNCFKIKY